MIFPGNRGMYTEELVFNTIDWYLKEGIACFFKSYVATNIGSSGSGKIIGCANVDFYGVYKGRYIEFEVKETHESFFLISQIKKHQFESLELSFKCGGISFLLLNFLHHDSIWLVNTSKLLLLKQASIKKIYISDMLSWGVPIYIEYPVIIDWIKALKI